MGSPHVTSRRITARISGTVASVGTGTITTIGGFPLKGYIVRVHAVLTGGSGSTVAPILSQHSGVTILVDQITSSSAAAHVDDVPTAPVYYETTDGNLYAKWVPNTASDNVVAYAIDVWTAA